MDEIFLNLLDIMSYCSIALSLMTVIFSIKLKLWRVFKLTYLVYYFAISFLIIVLSEFMHHPGGNNMPLLHLFTLLEFITISMFYKRALFNEINLQKSMIIFIVIVSVMIIVNSIYFQSIWAFNSYAKTLGQVFIIIYGVMYLFYKINKVGNIGDDELINSLNSALLIYFSGSLFIFMTGGTFDNATVFPLIVWVINSFFYVSFLLFINYNLWKIAYPRIRSSP